MTEASRELALVVGDCGWQNTGFIKISMSLSLKPKDVLPYLAKGICRFDKLRILRILSWSIQVVQSNHSSPHVRKARGSEYKGGIMMEAEVSDKGPEPRNAGGLQKLEKPRNRFSPRLSRRNAALPSCFELQASGTVRK